MYTTQAVVKLNLEKSLGQNFLQALISQLPKLCTYNCNDQSSSVQIHDLLYIHLYSSPSTGILGSHKVTSSQMA